MNTLLLLTLRKAKSLDTFRWNIRVELSRPVYKALHNIKSLRHLSLRLQEGPSLYETPSPPNWMGTSIPVPDVAFGVTPYPVISQAGLASSLDVSNPFITPSTSTSAPKPSSEGNSKKPALGKEPTTLAGFERLETIAILDIDNLNIVSEIRSCLRNSSSTLRKLKLSFSDSLASQARRPNLELDPEDSDQEDDFQIVPVPPAQYNDGSGPAKIFRAQEERKLQESVLGHIFEVEPWIIKESEPTVEEPSKDEKEQTAKDAGQTFIDSVDKASRAMLANLEGSSEFDIMSQEEVMEQIVTAAKRYVEAKETPAQESTSIGTTKTTPVAADNAIPEDVQQEDLEEQKEPPPSGNPYNAGFALFGTPTHAEDADTKPEDIDVAAPEEQLGIDGQDESNAETHLDDVVDTKPPVDYHKVSSLVKARG